VNSGSFPQVRCDGSGGFGLWEEREKMSVKLTIHRDEPEITASIGDVIHVDDGGNGTHAILSRADDNMLLAVCVPGGNRWCEPARVTDLHKITSNDLKKMFGRHKLTNLGRIEIVREQ
jgi:hypothetical protein